MPFLKIYVESVDADFSSTINRTIEVDPIVSAYTIRDLTPHTKYSISGSFFNGVYHPAEKSNVLNITTKESTPGPVSDVRWFDVTHESIRLVWSEPVEPNGIITGYSIQISEMVQNQPNKEISFSEKREGKMIHNITVDADTNERWIVNLTESTDYELEIAAMTKLGSGVLRKFKFSSGVPPELPQPPISINILNVSSRSAKIKFLHVSSFPIIHFCSSEVTQFSYHQWFLYSIKSDHSVVMIFILGIQWAYVN